MESKKIINALRDNHLDFVSLVKKVQEPSDEVEKKLHELENQAIIFFTMRNSNKSKILFS